MKQNLVRLLCGLCFALMPAIFGAAENGYAPINIEIQGAEGVLIPAGEAPSGTIVRVRVTVNGQEKNAVFSMVESRASGSAAGIPGAVPSPPPRPAPPVQPAPVKVTPRMPDPHSGRMYRVQVGAFDKPAYAERSFERLRNAGISSAYEQSGKYYRVVIPQVPAADMDQLIRRLGSAGFTEAWLREIF
jgi:cell division protein FtsN